MATTSHDSGLQISLPSKSAAPAAPAKPGAAPQQDRTGAKPKGAIWLNGDVLACACPECHSLMSIRAWLMVGDCTRCGTSIELTEEQEREALRLLEKQPAPPQPAAPQKPAAVAPSRPAAAPAPTTPTQRVASESAKPPAPAQQPPRGASDVAKSPAQAPAVRSVPQPARPRAPAPQATPPAPKPKPRPAQSRALPPALPAEPRLPEQTGRIPAALRPIGAEARVKKLATLGAARVAVHDFFKDLPAWLVSLVFHLVLIILLGLLERTEKVNEESITLSATVGTKDRAGERAVKDRKRDEVEFESPGKPKKVNPKVEAIAKADAEELIVPRDKPNPNLPKLETVLKSLEAPTKQRMFQGRDPRIRAAVVDHEGGTTYTEAAVTRGLRWISKHQNDNGSWSLNGFHHAGECDGQCNGPGRVPSDTAATALAILPMLGAGQTHLQGRYTEQVSKGLRWLLETQRPSGDLRGSGGGQMYAHGQAAIVLCEAYALTGDEQLREAAQRAVDFIVEAQHSEGGWRYQPKERGDTSVVGWQLMALRSAKMALLDVSEDTLLRAAGFLDQVQTDRQGGRYSYQPRGSATPAMSAEGLLCREYLGWGPEHPGLRAGLDYLSDNLPSERRPNMYYWYYATQVMHHVGGQDWQDWNAAMRDTLVSLQETDGHRAGSWSPMSSDSHSHAGGRLYMTSLAVCTLEVYYRHLPLYRAVEVK